MKVLLRIPLNTSSGYGNDGVGMALAFRQAGCDVHLMPSDVVPPLPPDVTDLLTKKPAPPYDVVIHHLDPPNLAADKRPVEAFTVAWTMWEMSSLDNMTGRSKLRSNLKNYDLVVGYDKVSTGALAPYVTGASATVQGGYWPQLWPFTPRDWNTDVTNFCMVGNLMDRKNPFVAIEAFQELQEERPELKMRLTLKTIGPGLHSKIEQWVPNVRVIYEHWDDDMMRSFYASQHVLIAPSRGEGKNLPCLEMLSTGGTVIATNIGGHAQWLSTSIGFPLDYELVPVFGKPDCLWADADKAHLKDLMAYAATNHGDLRRKGELAAELIPAMCAWPVAIDRLMGSIGEQGEKGERVLMAYREAKERVKESRVARELVGLL